MPEENHEIRVQIDQESVDSLDRAGFTASAKAHFAKVLSDYSNLLFDNARQESRNRRNQEVNEENVRHGAANLARKPAERTALKIGLALLVQILTAGTGIGASNITAGWGTILFGLTLFGALVANLILLRQLGGGD